MRFKLTVLFAALMLFAAIWSYEKAKVTHGGTDRSVQSLAKAPTCIRMYDYLKKYSEKYDVPFPIAMGIAWKESRYSGPFQWTYDPSHLVSSANAYGAMQIQVPTANFIWKSKSVTGKRLLNDLEFNVETSMKIMKYLYSISGNWYIALGYYNTGSPVINGYSIEIMHRAK